MYNIIANGNHCQYGTYALVADFESDIATAPTTVAPGSKIFCIENSTTYILTPALEWIAQSSGSKPIKRLDVLDSFILDMGILA